MLIRSFNVAFSADLRAPPRHQPAPEASADALWRTLQEAGRTNNISAYISAGRALRELGVLKPKPAMRLAHMLQADGRHEEALGLLIDPRLAPQEPDGEFLLQRAWAEVAAGSPALALKMLEDADRLRLQATQASTAARLRKVVGHAQQSWRFEDWADLDEALSDCLELRLWRHAALALETWLEAGSDGSRTDMALERAIQILRRIGPDDAGVLLKALESTFDRLGERSAFDATWLALHEEEASTKSTAPNTPTADEPVRVLLWSCLAEACAAASRWRAAIGRFRVFPRQPGIRAHNICELARCVGRDLLSIAPLNLRETEGRKIFDLFPFNGEFAMLELKLAEMGDWVDHFVIVEATRTFRNDPKPLHYQQNRETYRKYGDKIIHVVVDQFPDYLDSAWAREFHQRDSAARGLNDLAGPDDLVIISDADEIIDRRALEFFTGDAMGMELRTFQYFYNRELLDKRRVKSAITTARVLATNGSSYLRIGCAAYFRAKSSLPRAGWHFTGVGAPEVVEAKIRSYSHEERSYLDRAKLEVILSELRRGESGEPWVRREIDESFPQYIRQNVKALSPYIL